MARLLLRHPWLVPLAFGLLLGVVGWSTVRGLEARERETLGAELESTLRSATESLSVWVRNNEATVEVFLRDPRVREAVAELARVSRIDVDPSEALRAAPEQQTLRDILAPVAAIHGFAGWGVQDLSGLMIANQSDAQIGFRPAALSDRRRELVEDRAIIHSAPVFYDTPTGPIAVMIAGGAVEGDQGRVVATMGFAIAPQDAFSHILEAAKRGESGETYAFDLSGTMVSASRFENPAESGSAADGEPAGSILHTQVRDPGGNLLEGFEPTLPMAARPFTRSAGGAIAGETGLDLDGYPDYRGVPVVGAWTWIPSLRVGIASEIDVAEAYAGLREVQWRMALVMSLLAVATAGIAIYSWTLKRLQGKVDAAQRLGRYQVERRLGEGGMGKVYLARHALLRRPTAIKVLESAAASEEAMARFEREVQVSSSLSHPNTIEIYDYGHSSHGDFYYAMEYVRGPTLATLVGAYGAQPEARVREILLQASGSVAEAHARGLIHRDLKPANIMLCERGGIRDFVKVLDFGLVRARDPSEDVSITQTRSLTGTPLYMSPEALEDPSGLDARGDVYQLGAVAYFLLTGRPPFEGDGLVEVLAKHMTQRPAQPAEVLGFPVSEGLSELILRCLAKSPDDRFADAGELFQAWSETEVTGEWTRVMASAWWDEWEQNGPEAGDPSSPSSSGSSPSGYSIDLLETGRRSIR